MAETPANQRPPAAPKGALLTVILVVIIDLLGFGIVLPLLPRYADRLLEPAGVERQLHGLVTGCLLAVFSLMQFIFAPIWGRISDRVGRRPILILGLAGSVIFYALFGYASSLGTDQAGLALALMFAARIGAGIAGATIATAQAVIADCTPKEKRAQGMALIGAAFGIGFTVGPLVAGAALIFFPDRPEFAGYSAAGLSFVAWTIAMFKMPETARPDGMFKMPETAGLGPRRGWLDLRGLTSTLKTPTVGILVLTFFLATFGFAGFEATLSLLTRDMGYSDQDNFWIFAYVGAILMLTQAFIYRRLVKKYHEVQLMRLGVGFMFLGLVGLAAVAMSGDSSLRPTALFISLALGVIGFAFLTPSAQALISKRSDPARQGEVLGVNQSCAAMARILGPVTGLVLFKAESTHMLPYAASAVLLVIVMALLTKVGRD
jgi:MFS family permease